MKKILLLPFFCMLSLGSNAQIDSSDYKDNQLFLYKTEDDFFNQKRKYRGQYIPYEDTKIIKYSPPTSKKNILNLEDSCSYYFGYALGDEIQIRPDKDPRNFTYYSFGGGTKEYYCVAYGHLGNYDKQGYLLGLTSPAGRAQMYFIDRTRNLYMVQLPEFLQSNPKLLEQYKTEKAGMKKLDWERNKLAISIKYLKLFIAQHS